MHPTQLTRDLPHATACLSHTIQPNKIILFFNFDFQLQTDAHSSEQIRSELLTKPLFLKLWLASLVEAKINAYPITHS